MKRVRERKKLVGNDLEMWARRDGEDCGDDTGRIYLVTFLLLRRMIVQFNLIAFMFCLCSRAMSLFDLCSRTRKSIEKEWVEGEKKEGEQV